jgi:hypothetical protein
MPTHDGLKVSFKFFIRFNINVFNTVIGKFLVVMAVVIVLVNVTCNLVMLDMDYLLNSDSKSLQTNNETSDARKQVLEGTIIVRGFKKIRVQRIWYSFLTTTTAGFLSSSCTSLTLR